MCRIFTSVKEVMFSLIADVSLFVSKTTRQIFTEFGGKVTRAQEETIRV